MRRNVPLRHLRLAILLVSVPYPRSQGPVAVGAVELPNEAATTGTSGAPGLWAEGFGLPGLDSFPFALGVFDDGTGPALFVGGDMTTAGNVVASSIARWNGSAWSSLGSGLGGLARWPLAMAVYDDGSGSALFVGGTFESAGGESVGRIAKWNGSIWSGLGGGLDNSALAMTVFDDGMGPALYVGGFFKLAGGVTVNGIARWDGAAWSPLGSGVGGATSRTIRALTVFDDGNGAALYAAGNFTIAGSTHASGVAKWDGAGWSPLGSGIIGDVYALTVFDDGMGPALYAGGRFTEAGGVVANNIAKWSGTEWFSLSDGFPGPDSGPPPVSALAVFNDGQGPALYAGGSMFSSGETLLGGIAKWNGAEWCALEGGVSGVVHALTVFDDGDGPQLYVAGLFGAAGGVHALYLAKWNGLSWSALPDIAPANGVSGSVRALATYDDGLGPAVYAGGDFRKAGGVLASRVAKWNGFDWSALEGGGASSGVRVLAVSRGPGTPSLVVGGSFRSISGIPFGYIAEWDGSSWYGLGNGLDDWVSALCPYDDGDGPALYVGGEFTTAGGIVSNGIARWDGLAWEPLGLGMGGSAPSVEALVTFDDGDGVALYAGGAFLSAGASSAHGIAKWTGTTWSEVGGAVNGVVYALTVFDDGTGSALYAGGYFNRIGLVNANRVAKWNGTTWSPLGRGFDSPVYALTAFDDGTGLALHAGGSFGVAKWDGSAWVELGTGVNGAVHAFTVLEDAVGPTLYVGGAFTTAGGRPSSDIAAWMPDCNRNGVPNGCDLECGKACTAWNHLPGCGASRDCDGNRIPDECDLAAGAPDQNRNQIPDVCELLGDCDGNNVVDLNDARTFVECVNGPAFDRVYDCRCDDLKADGYVDLLDVAEFLRRFGSVRD